MKANSVLFAKAIADETRQKIMSECCCCWLSVNEIVEKMEVSQPTVSHHLSVLKEAGLVQAVRNAGFRDVVLLGMGGSSLGAEVLRQVFGEGEARRRTMAWDPQVKKALEVMPRAELLLEDPRSYVQAREADRKVAELVAPAAARP